jgi:hypothetical protein
VERGRWGTSIAAVGALAVLAGCSRGSSAEAPSTTAGPLWGEVLVGYEAYWDAVLAASDPADPASEALVAAALDPELASIRALLTSRAEAGLTMRGSFVHADQVVSVEGDTAEVEDCLAAAVSVAAPSGHPSGPPPAVRRAISVRMAKVDQRWRVAEIREAGPCPSDDEARVVDR